jgi:coproporphyrinogen III oxidase-like Fe-S oxidoreductase
MLRLPDGEPAPPDGMLPAAVLAGVGTRPFGVYVHVPFCASRCGYCDFNTYVPGRGASPDGFVDAVLAEWALADRVLDRRPTASTVFVGGGTPTLLPVTELARLLADRVARELMPRRDRAVTLLSSHV